MKDVLSSQSRVRSEFLKTMIERGYPHQYTHLEELDDALVSGIVPAYIGFDATADSLHVGSLVQIMMLRWLQKNGHKPVVLMGGGTTLIGDPSGRDESRQMLSQTQIEDNKLSLQTIFARYLTFGDGSTDAVMIDNAVWLSQLNYMDFLREYGPYFTINQMLTFDSVKSRLDREKPMTFLEFNYMILQGYDFLELNRRYGVTLQMGGSDQWGNIVNGTELIRRIDRKRAFGLTSPLLTTSSGTKMGKTAAGAVWLNEDRLSAFDLWQFWRNVRDDDVKRFLLLYTELPLDEIDRLGALGGVEINEAKKILADQVVGLARGEHTATAVRQTAETTFEQDSAGTDLPTISIAVDTLMMGSMTVVDLLLSANMAASRGEARRLIRGGGVAINGVKVMDDRCALCGTDMIDGKARVSAGKKRRFLVKTQP